MVYSYASSVNSESGYSAFSIHTSNLASPQKCAIGPWAYAGFGRTLVSFRVALRWVEVAPKWVHFLRLRGRTLGEPGLVHSRPAIALARSVSAQLGLTITPNVEGDPDSICFWLSRLLSSSSLACQIRHGRRRKEHCCRSCSGQPRSQMNREKRFRRQPTPSRSPARLTLLFRVRRIS